MVWTEPDGTVRFHTAGRGQRGDQRDLARRALPDDPQAGPVTAGAVPRRAAGTHRIGRRWHRGRHRRAKTKKFRPVQNHFPYEMARYLAFDALTAGALAAGFTLGGTPGAVAGAVAVAATKGIVAATLNRMRDRGDLRWETRQEDRHRTGEAKDVEQDKRFTRIEADLAALRRQVSPAVPARSAASPVSPSRPAPPRRALPPPTERRGGRSEPGRPRQGRGERTP